MRTKSEMLDEILRANTNLGHSWQNVQRIIEIKMEVLRKCMTLDEEGIKYWKDEVERDHHAASAWHRATVLRQLNWVLQTSRKSRKK